MNTQMEGQNTTLIKEGVSTQFGMGHIMSHQFDKEIPICFSTALFGMVRIALYDKQNKLVKQLFTGILSPGRYKLIFNGKRDDGHRIANGDYICSMEADGFSAIRKLNMPGYRQMEKKSIHNLKPSVLDRLRHTFSHLPA